MHSPTATHSDAKPGTPAGTEAPFCEALVLSACLDIDRCAWRRGSGSAELTRSSTGSDMLLATCHPVLLVSFQYSKGLLLDKRSHPRVNCCLIRHV